MSDGKREQWVMYSGMALVLLLLIGVGLRSAEDGKREARALQWVTHTYRVLESIEAMLSGLGSAESAVRGYVITRDPTLLADVGPGVAQARTSWGEAATLVADNAPQAARLASLQPVLEERLRLIEQQVAAARDGAEVAFQPKGRALTETIRQGAAALSRVEQDLLTRRVAESERRTLAAEWTTPLATLTAVTLMLLVFAMLRHQMNKRVQSEEAAHRSVQQMEHLHGLNELLSSCRRVDEAYDVVSRKGALVFGGDGGSVALFPPSRDLLEQHARWGVAPASAAFAPDECWALRRGRPHPSRAGDVCCAHLGAGFTGEALCLPLMAHGEVIGLLQLRGPTDDDVVAAASVVAESIALAFANLQLRETLRNQSVRDALTGLYNRRYTEETFGRELSRARREQRPLCLLMLDVDHFKRFNDTFGHDAGDHVLRELAAVLKVMTRGSDIAARLGGEELCVLLPNATVDDGAHRAEEIRAAVAALALRHGGTSLGKVTVSIGVAGAPDHADDVATLMKQADAALYRAKNTGRDRVALATSGAPPSEAPATAKGAAEEGAATSTARPS